MKKHLLDKVTQLFYSKGKQLTAEMAATWVSLLNEKYPIDITLKAIDKLIWSADDFPTVGKVAEEIEQTMKSFIRNEIFESTPEMQNICKELKINLEYIKEDPSALNRNLQRIIDYKKQNSNQITHDNKRISNEK